MSTRLPMVVEESGPPAQGASGLPATTDWALDVRGYLARRSPCAHPRQEPELFAMLPDSVQSEVEDLLQAYAIILAAPSFRKGADQAAREAVAWGRRWSAKRLRLRLAKYHETQDWLCLVNRAAAGPLWQKGSARVLPPEFIHFASARFAAFRRDDGGRAAVRSIVQQWRTGRDRDGNPAPIPGYGFWPDWWAKEFPGLPLPPVAPLPAGWSYDNIRRKARLTPAVKALCHDGIASARKYTPDVARTRVGLRFLELVECDDVKMDFRVFDPKSGQVMDLWLLVAVDKASGMLLGYGMRPARVREDGTQEHLRQIDMKQLAGGVVERWGLPVGYPLKFQLENGTATLPAAVAQALGLALSERVKVVLARMIGGESPVGYKERAKGNSNAKSSLESTNRLHHTNTADLPGQTGRRYDLRPADLAAREKEAVVTWKTHSLLPAHLQSQTGYPLLTLAQAREHLRRVFEFQNERTDHDLEGFESILEWRPNSWSAWAPASTAPADLPEDAEFRERKQSPRERAEFLRSTTQFDKVHPSVLRAFYDQTQRLVKVTAKGEIGFESEKRELVFRDARPDGGLPPKSQWLVYYNPEEPALLHVLHPKTGIYVATWLRRERVGWGDEEALRAAIRYTEAALKAHREKAAALLAPEREQRQARLARNAALLASDDFIEMQGSQGVIRGGVPISPSTAAVQAATEARAAHVVERDLCSGSERRKAARMESDAESALDALMPDPTDLQ